MWKDAQIFWANLQRSIMPGTAFNSPTRWEYPVDLPDDLTTTPSP